MDLIIFNVGQTLLVIIAGYLIVLGIGVALERANLLRNRLWQYRKQRIADKLEIKELKKYESEIDKVEPIKNEN